MPAPYRRAPLTRNPRCADDHGLSHASLVTSKAGTFGPGRRPGGPTTVHPMIWGTHRRSIIWAVPLATAVGLVLASVTYMGLVPSPRI